MDLKKFIDDMLKCTEVAALAAYHKAGLRDENKADASAVNAMRDFLNLLSIDIKVAIGEGERDDAPMLFIGEKLGNITSQDKIDLAVDPLECTKICANLLDGGSLSVLCFADRGDIINAPDLYMDKIILSPDISPEGISINNSVSDNLMKIMKYKGCKPNEITVTILDRDRHAEIISQVIKFGSRVRLIKDGDISAAIGLIKGEYDLYLGIGGAPEGVMIASIINSLGGYMESKLFFRNDSERERAKLLGIRDDDFVYKPYDLVKGESVFIATGVTAGCHLKGIVTANGEYKTNSIIIYKNTLREINSKIKT
ncbi:fructose-bisphosphatase class II [Anaplasmataceae bacterium AB001_6]|nr:fructose-bisphosphatase class II [Anaplasmataceae bacterium AB001_6]